MECRGDLVITHLCGLAEDKIDRTTVVYHAIDRAAKK